jgi:hypothetical protein
MALTMALHPSEPNGRATWSKLTQRLVGQRCDTPASHIGTPFVDTHPLATRFGLTDGPRGESSVNRRIEHPPLMRASANVSKSVIAEGFSPQGQLHRRCGHLTDLGHRALIARHPSGTPSRRGPRHPDGIPNLGEGSARTVNSGAQHRCVYAPRVNTFALDAGACPSQCRVRRNCGPGEHSR